MFKCTDLMIGDFVYKPNSIDNTKMIIGKVEADDFYYGRTQTFKGIPLTKEILDKNGFVWDDDFVDDENFETAFINNLDTIDCYEIVIGWRDSYDNGASDAFNQVSWDECWKLHCMCCLKSFDIEYSEKIYIHELQHVLKLCDIKKEIKL